MKKLSHILIIVSLLATIGALVASSAAVFADGGFVSGSAVRATQQVTARWGPGLSWSVRYTIFEGQLATVCGPHPDYGANTVNGFVRVMYEGRIGWVPARYLTIKRIGPPTWSWADYQPPRYYLGICPYGTAAACGYRNMW